MSNDFISKIIAPEKINAPALWFIFCQNQIIIAEESEKNTDVLLPKWQNLDDFGFEVILENYIGTWRGYHCFTVEIQLPESIPPKFILQPLRQAGLRMGDVLFRVASRAFQILNWNKNHQFCGRCGQPLSASDKERVKTCEYCHLPHYPRLSPAVMVLIKRGKEILLARSPHFLSGIYSALAGFIEVGETVEEAIEREVMEEVGLKVKNLQYRFSQSWPFPDSLMLAFTAEYAAGEIVIDGIEIEDAGWYTIENLPTLPMPLSIARRLINLFINKEF